MLHRELIFPVHGSQCHASTLAPLSGGRFLAAWFEGRREGDPTCAIRFATREADGHWTAPETIAKVSFEAHWNPVLYRHANGELMLFFKVGRKIASWRTYIMHSQDEGHSWSDPVELVPGDTAGGRGPVKNPPIYDDMETIIAPASYEINGRWCAFTDLSHDDGRTWQRSQDVPMPSGAVDAPWQNNRLGLIQPTLWKSDLWSVHMLLRSNNHRIYRSDSHDGGRSWCEAYPTDLPNNNSGICLARFQDGTLLVAANLHPSNGGGRETISLIASHDNGRTWGSPALLEASKETDALAGSEPELSYPTLLPLPDGNSFALTYTWNRRSIAFVTGSHQDIA